MKRNYLRCFVLCIAAAVVFCVLCSCAVFADEAAKVTKQNSADVVITAYDAGGNEIGALSQSDTSKSFETEPAYYNITYNNSSIVESGYYVLFALSGSSENGSIPTVTSSNLIFIDQVTATSAGTVTFNKVYPKEFTNSIIVVAGTGVTANIIASVDAVGNVAEKIGDVDNSGAVDIGDVTTILRHIVKISGLDSQELVAADVDHSGAVDIGDVTMILRYIVKIISVLE